MGLLHFPSSLPKKSFRKRGCAQGPKGSAPEFQGRASELSRALDAVPRLRGLHQAWAWGLGFRV